MSDITIRPAQTHAELHACVDLEIAVWQVPDRDAVPFHQLHAAHTWGGQVIIAFDGDRPVGFSYGFGGRQYGRPALCSHMLAVLPEYRGRDIGARLKLAQARWALENGYDLITWTYDPLQAVNANLNIARLGGIARQYMVDHYGEMDDGLNAGLPTDRLLLEWHLNRPSVARILAGETSGSQGHVTLGGETPAASIPADAIRVPIPRNLPAIMATDPAAALRWRLAVRDQMVAPMAQGYAVTSFHIDADSAAYILTKEL